MRVRTEDLKGRLPPRLRRWARWAVDVATTGRRITADGVSWWAYARVSAPSARPAPPLRLRIKRIPEPIEVRPGTADWTVVQGTFNGHNHLPTSHDPSLIWDLGGNIGLTAADLGARYPNARIVVLEPDPANAEAARRNTRWLGSRCVVVEAAFWLSDGEVKFSTSPGREAGAHVAPDGTLTVKAVSPATLVAEHGVPTFVKMDIEGAERQALAPPADWLTRVHEIRVECHGSYTPADCARDLEAAGFHTQVMPERMSRDSVVGVR